MNNKLSGEKIVFSDSILKINNKLLEQKRILIITEEAIYNFRENTLKRRIPIKSIKAITASKTSDEFVIHGEDNEYDYHYKYKNKKKKNLKKIYIYMEKRYSVDPYLQIDPNTNQKKIISRRSSDLLILNIKEKKVLKYIENRTKSKSPFRVVPKLQSKGTITSNSINVNEFKEKSPETNKSFNFKNSLILFFCDIKHRMYMILPFKP